MVADHKKVSETLLRARDKIDEILDAYRENDCDLALCDEIMTAQDIVYVAQREVMIAHLENCIREATGKDASKKIKEVLEVLRAETERKIAGGQDK